MTRILVYGDSNSWGFPAEDPRKRMATRWPVVMQNCLGKIDLIEECLPGRTTVHDDPEHLGEANNGMRFLEVALRSHAPVDVLVVLLGVNDLKARFQPNAAKIAENVGRLIDEARRVGGGTDLSEDKTPPKIAVIIPPALTERAIDPAWDRQAEWAGGREASLGFPEAFAAMGEARDVAVFDSAPFVQAGADDPIHWTGASHQRLGEAVADWLKTLGDQ